MTWVKICGTTNLEDALTAVDAGADALGFIFYEKSPRRIDPETASGIVFQLPPKVEKVGVFVNESPARMIEIGRRAGLTAFQVHSGALATKTDPQAGWYPGPGIRIYLALPAAPFFEQNIQWVPSGRGLADPVEGIAAIFLDSGTEQRPGGTGATFDWEKAAPVIASMSQDTHVVVAGGLNPSNVCDAIRILHPWGVDVASGVEARPGKKDPKKVREFVQAVRRAEKSA
ncbi:MAG: N-(5'-phosphoribosyl)anthranilate isomerase [Acidobacteria bacterium]|nr:MAG: N-(5'-phosphoribosyl)anthranilate isomerase [Acidobacteriota bacterium]